MVRQRGVIPGAVLACALALSVPAQATDLVLARGDATVLARNAVGKPYWRLLAYCAGLYGARSNQLGATDSAGAARNRAAGVSFLNDALQRLSQDRALTRTQALRLAQPVVVAGRGDGAALLDDPNPSTLRQWDLAENLCVDVAEAYARVSISSPIRSAG